MKKIAIIGAGAAGERFINTILCSNLKQSYAITAIFDDDQEKINSTIHGFKIIDSTKNLDNYDDLFDTIIIAIPSSSEKEFDRIYNLCIKTRKKVLTIPSLKNILSKTHEISSVRDINIKDLIDRDEMPINHTNIAKAVKGKVVLITGGGGSIGSVIFNLCLENHVKKIVCIDSSEYNTYKLMQSIHNKNNITFFR